MKTTTLLAIILTLSGISVGIAYDQIHVARNWNGWDLSGNPLSSNDIVSNLRGGIVHVNSRAR